MVTLRLTEHRVKPVWAFSASLHRNKGLNLSRCLFLASPANDLESRTGLRVRMWFWGTWGRLGCPELLAARSKAYISPCLREVSPLALLEGGLDSGWWTGMSSERPHQTWLSSPRYSRLGHPVTEWCGKQLHAFLQLQGRFPSWQRSGFQRKKRGWLAWDANIPKVPDPLPS